MWKIKVVEESNIPEIIPKGIEIEVRLNLNFTFPHINWPIHNKTILHVSRLNRSRIKEGLIHTQSLDLELILKRLNNKPLD